MMNATELSWYYILYLFCFADGCARTDQHLDVQTPDLERFCLPERRMPEADDDDDDDVTAKKTP